MPITIVKKANAPVLPRADPIVVEPHCDFVEIPKTLDIDIGPGLELYRCTECGATARNREKQGTLLSQCDRWAERQARTERRR